MLWVFEKEMLQIESFGIGMLSKKAVCTKSSVKTSVSLLAEANRTASPLCRPVGEDHFRS